MTQLRSMIVSGPLMGGGLLELANQSARDSDLSPFIKFPGFPNIRDYSSAVAEIPDLLLVAVAAALVTDSRQIHKWGTYPICRSQICPERKEISWSLKFSSSLFNLILTCAVYPLITLLIRISPFPLAP